MRHDIYSRGVTHPRESHASRMSRSHTPRDVVHRSSPSFSTSRIKVEFRTHARLQALTLHVVALVRGGEARTRRGGTKVATSTTVAVSPPDARFLVLLAAGPRWSRARGVS